MFNDTPDLRFDLDRRDFASELQYAGACQLQVATVLHLSQLRQAECPACTARGGYACPVHRAIRDLAEDPLWFRGCDEAFSAVPSRVLEEQAAISARCRP